MEAEADDTVTLIRRLAAALATTAEAIQRSPKGIGLDKAMLAELEDVRSLASRVAGE